MGKFTSTRVAAFKAAILSISLMVGAVMQSCQSKSPEEKSTTDISLLSEDSFRGDNNNIRLITLKSGKGLVTQITNYGGRVVNLWLPDRGGIYKDVVLGCETVDQYSKCKEKYLGALIGRYGNRIAKGKFTLNETEYNLVVNNGENHLHGGTVGFESVIWDVISTTESSVTLHYLSKDGEEGYPGDLDVTVIYNLTDSNGLEITYKATTTAATPVNLTHHSFFNLKGAGKGDVNSHKLTINADKFTPVNSGLIPTGEERDVTDTPFDFRAGKLIGRDIKSTNTQMVYGNGYDHNFIINGEAGELREAAKIVEPQSGRSITVFTNEPAMQLYGGNFIDGSVKGKQGLVYGFRGAFCLETQHYPDSPNQPNFPSTILNPGETYSSQCTYKFGIEK